MRTYAQKDFLQNESKLEAPLPGTRLQAGIDHAMAHMCVFASQRFLSTTKSRSVPVPLAVSCDPVLVPDERRAKSTESAHVLSSVKSVLVFNNNFESKEQYMPNLSSVSKMSLSVSVPCVDISPPMRPITGYAANSVTDPRLNCKSRVPDIQMINRYYGLVPKKFLINRRADLKSLRSQLGFSGKQGFEPPRNNRQKFLRSASLECTNNVNNGRESSHRALVRPATTNGRRETNNNSNNNGQQQLHQDLVAHKMKVSSHNHNNGNHRRFYKDLRGRSSSLCENFYDLDHPFDCGVCSYGFGGESCQESEGSTTPDEPDVQRVIKINLHSMKWEESFNVRPESQSKGVKSVTGGRRPLRKSASVEENFCTKASESSSLGNEAGFLAPTKGENIVKSLESSSGPSPKTVVIKARAKSAKPSPAETLAERRRKFGAFKTTSLSQAQQESKGESSEEEEDPFPKSILAKHSFLKNVPPSTPPGSESIKNGLHVQQPPEVTTMISSIAPLQDGSCKQEDTAALTEELLTNIIKMTNGIALSSSASNSYDSNTSSSEEEAKVIVTTSPAEPSFMELKKEKSPEKALNPSSSVSTPIEPNGRQESHYKHNVPPLRKAASISCEQEEILTASPGSHDALNSSAADGSKPRCKTAKVRGSVSFAKTASMKFIPARIRSSVPSPTVAATVPPFCIPPTSSIKNKQLKVTEVESMTSCDTTTNSIASSAAHYQISRPLSSSSTPSRASKNRRLLLKKALAELNQASASLNKKLKSQPHQVQQRPKTAPNHHQQQSKANNSGDKSGRRHRSSDEKNKESGGGQPEGQEVSKIQQAKRRPISRQQSITFMENLFGSTSSLNGDEGPSRSLDMDEQVGFEEKKNSRRLEKASSLSIGKREECMRIYDKMKKKGCSVSLETIFRGMMTPSEYRIFMESLENEERAEEEPNV